MQGFGAKFGQNGKFVKFSCREISCHTESTCHVNLTPGILEIADIHLEIVPC